MHTDTYHEKGKSIQKSPSTMDKHARTGTTSGRHRARVAQQPNYQPRAATEVCDRDIAALHPLQRSHHSLWGVQGGTGISTLHTMFQRPTLHSQQNFAGVHAVGSRVTLASLGTEERAFPRRVRRGYSPVCATCHNPAHKAKDCYQTPETSLYKQRRTGARPRPVVTTTA